MVGFLFGLQGGYTKFSSFLCLRDSRARTEHWLKKNWPVRSELIPGSLNVLAPPLVERVSQTNLKIFMGQYSLFKIFSLFIAAFFLYMFFIAIAQNGSSRERQ